MNALAIFHGCGSRIAGCLALLSASTAAATASADAREAAQRAVAATVAVEWKQGEDALWKASPRAEAVPGLAAELDSYRWRGLETSHSSGTVVSPSGLVVTFAAAGDQHSIQVTLADGRSLPAKRLVVDRRSQLVLLKVDAEDLDHVALAERAPEIGETVVAAMCADVESRIVGRGIVAATDRKVAGTLPRLIQTDVQVTRMSAGSPLVNEEGELVGVIVAKSDKNASENRSAFAVPAGLVRELIDAQRHSRDAEGEGTEVVVARGYLGVSLDGESDTPVVRSVIADAPAAHVDIEEGDTIVAVDGFEVNTTKDATEAIASKPGGEVVVLDLQRSGKPIKVRVRLGERQEPKSAAASPDYNVDAVEAGRLWLYGQTGEPIAVDAGDVLGQLDPYQYHVVTPQVQESQDKLKAEENSNERYLYWYRALSDSAGKPQAPVLRVERSDLDKKLESLTGEVERLRKQVEALSEQLNQLSERLGKE